jgi:UDP-N-acetylglucosamine:LPS N-acetylglucosamine transferase
MPLIVFSEEARRRVLRRLRKYALKGTPAALPEPPVTVMPPILDKRFASFLPPEVNARNRAALGFSPDKPLILLAGGGDGLPQGELYLAALGVAKLDIQIAMVCGKNRAQYDICSVIAKLNPKKNMTVYGFVNNMYELMNMCDIVVAKGGPATIFEVLALHKPLIIMKHLYGQEKGNVDFVVRHGLGWFENTPQRVVRRLTQLISQPEVFNDVRHRLERVQVGIGTQAISDRIMKM